MANIYKIKGNLYALRGKLVKIDARDPFRVKINTALGNGFNSFTLPLSNHATNIKVRTSDGQSFTITDYLDSARTINFPTAGIYTIELRGVCGWSFNNTGDCQKVIGVKWGSSFKFSYLDGGFYGCINLGLNEGLSTKGYIRVVTAGAISVSNLFNTCNLQNLGNDKLFHKIKISSAKSMLSANRLTYLSDDVLKGQTSISTITTLLTNNTTLTDMHPDCYRDLVNCRDIYNTHNGCNLTVLRKGWHQAFSKVINAHNAYANNRLSIVEPEAFDTLVNCTTMLSVLANNNLATVPNRIFFKNKKVTVYSGTLRNQRVPMALPSEIWDLSAISIVTNWNAVLSATSTALSPTGTVQPIWDYASPTATKTDALNNCTALNNYNDSPIEWR